MTGAERGYLLLCSHLGDPRRKCLTIPQFRKLALRMKQQTIPAEDRELTVKDLKALGYGAEDALRITELLSEEDRLDRYLKRGATAGCFPLTRISPEYPRILLKRLGENAPGVLWYKGDATLLTTAAIALVGSRGLLPDNAAFAREAGLQAALQGFALISGNARGADRTAQNACLDANGAVICVVADNLADYVSKDRVLYLSEDCFDFAFSPQRALSRNCVIHALGRATLVAQSTLKQGGTWDGTVKNLRFGWTPLYCFNDGRESTRLLEQMGATLIEEKDLLQLTALPVPIPKLF